MEQRGFGDFAICRCFPQKLRGAEYKVSLLDLGQGGMLTGSVLSVPDGVILCFALDDAESLYEACTMHSQLSIRMGVPESFVPPVLMVGLRADVAVDEELARKGRDAAAARKALYAACSGVRGDGVTSAVRRLLLRIEEEVYMAGRPPRVARRVASASETPMEWVRRHEAREESLRVFRRRLRCMRAFLGCGGCGPACEACDEEPPGPTPDDWAADGGPIGGGAPPSWLRRVATARSKRRRRERDLAFRYYIGCLVPCCSQPCYSRWEPIEQELWERSSRRLDLPRVSSANSLQSMGEMTPSPPSKQPTSPSFRSGSEPPKRRPPAPSLQYRRQTDAKLREPFLSSNGPPLLATDRLHLQRSSVDSLVEIGEPRINGERIPRWTAPSRLPWFLPFPERTRGGALYLASVGRTALVLAALALFVGVLTTIATAAAVADASSWTELLDRWSLLLAAASAATASAILALLGIHASNVGDGRLLAVTRVITNLSSIGLLISLPFPITSSLFDLPLSPAATLTLTRSLSATLLALLLAFAVQSARVRVPGIAVHRVRTGDSIAIDTSEDENL